MAGDAITRVSLEASSGEPRSVEEPHSFAQEHRREVEFQLFEMACLQALLDLRV